VAGPGDAALHGRRILIVDDNRDAMDMAKVALELHGFSVDTRCGVNEVGTKGARGFDLILMAVQMAEIYGDDIAVALRTQRNVDTPIYLFSYLDDAELAQRAREAQIEGYISKRAGIENMVAEVRRILAERAARVAT
jgi:two-component system, OmpR family, alkaline phosphatase synthesis response regulator PhoP